MSKRERIKRLLDKYIDISEKNSKSYRGTKKDNAVILSMMYSNQADQLKRIKIQIENILDGI